jgi:hypothetical protein
MHPYCYPTLPNDSNAAWSCYKQQWTVHDIMAANGDGAKLSGTPKGRPPPGRRGQRGGAGRNDPQVLQAGRDNAWMGPQMVYTLRDPGVSTPTGK